MITSNNNNIMMIIVIKFYCIAPHPFQSGGVDVEVLFQNDENVTVVATITFMVCIYNDVYTNTKI